MDMTVLETMPETALRQASVRKARSALLVIDMQRYFAGIAEPIVSNFTKVIDACRSARMPIIFTQHGYRDPMMDAGMLGEWWGDPILIGTSDWEFLPGVLPHDEDRVVAKKRYDAFFGTDLEMLLRSFDVQDVIIGGVMTNLCCETTAREAFVRDFRVFFLADGTATVSEAYQLASLKNLAYGFAYLKRCDEVVEDLTEDDD